MNRYNNFYKKLKFNITKLVLKKIQILMKRLHTQQKTLKINMLKIFQMDNKKDNKICN